MSGRWTAEREAQAGRLWAAGHTASAIAAALGRGVTRSAVIAKIHRLGLADSRPTVQAARGTAPADRTDETIVDAPAPVPVVQPDPEPEPAPVEPLCRLFDESAAARAFGPLTLSTCRWPLGDPRAPDFAFCCERVAVVGKPYCAAHAQRAYTGTIRRLVPTSRAGALHGRAA